MSMPRDYLPASDAAFDLWLRNFNDELITRGTALGFSAAEVSNLGDALGEWDLAFSARLGAGAAARAATAEKRARRRAALLLIRPYVRRVQAHATMTDAVRAAMRLTLLEDGTNGSNGGGAPVDFDAVPLLLLDFGTRGQIKVHRPEPGQREPQRPAGRRDRRRASDARRQRGRRGSVGMAGQPLGQPAHARRAAVGGHDDRLPLRVPVPPRPQRAVERAGRGGGDAVSGEGVMEWGVTGRRCEEHPGTTDN